MPKKKAVSVDDIQQLNQEVAAAQVAETDPVEVPVEGKTSWDIYDDAEQYVRTYSIADHGENAEALAKMYVEGHPNCHIR